MAEAGGSLNSLRQLGLHNSFQASKSYIVRLLAPKTRANTYQPTKNKQKEKNHPPPPGKNEEKKAQCVKCCFGNMSSNPENVCKSWPCLSQAYNPSLRSGMADTWISLPSNLEEKATAGSVGHSTPGQ